MSTANFKLQTVIYTYTFLEMYFTSETPRDRGKKVG